MTGGLIAGCAGLVAHAAGLLPALALVLAQVFAVGFVPAAQAQTPSGLSAPTSAPAPTTAAGPSPRFPALGPGSTLPDSEGAARPSSPLPPGRTARCRWDLRGGWDSRGQQTDPQPNTYSARVNIRQYGNYLVAEQPGDNLTYYGICTGDRVELDAYQGDSFIGMQTGTIGANGRRIESTWVLYNPDYAAGYETLTASGRSGR